MEKETDPSDRLISFKQAAAAVGLPYFKIQRAAARGDIPTYSFFNGRKYVKLRDIEARISTQN